MDRIGRMGADLMREYEVFLEEAEDGGYVVICPALPGCVSEGETREEALANIKDAIEGYLTTLRRRGESLPKVDTEIVEVAA
jgi:antitoxin HicB